ncbi:hypothetical protein Dsin_014059 [Dipteronia sinensis]|uniref:Protein kinase domain-containing protein n=1 Tax=Dipteronia sinensis TaxID=43782 RepID=A0AAE0E9P5_9ROSI|nr:hypothetical protein Dsin_014059 [Dipteronia sinensis]
MEIFKHLMFSFISIAALTVMVHAESQSGFISIDCGLPENSVYTDKNSGINYTSDATFTETGVSYNISSEYNSSTLEQQFLNVRSFPEGTRNCYTIKPALENIKFLIRARFMYGNYDGRSKVPSFDLLLGADVWDSVELENASTIVTKEIIHIPRSNYVYVCFINTGSGTPFISSLEFRVLKNTTYETESGSLLLYLRWDLGSTTNKTIRYQDDIYDRIWEPYNRPEWTPINTSSVVFPDIYKQPSTVMSTGVTPANVNDSLTFSWATSDNTTQYFIYLYFAELQQDQMTKHNRQMYIYVNRELWYTKPYVLEYLEASTLYTSGPIDKLDEFSINKTEESPLPPILNALELYKVKDFLQLLTNQQDVDAIMNIKTKYGVKRSKWQGDPCTPKAYLWRGLNCSYNEYNPPRIIFLNLSSSGLAGEIPPFISSLTVLESLDLSNNSLIGPVPGFLSQLAYLKVLNLAGNKLQGSVPAELIERGDNGFLILSVDGNPDLCLSTSCTKRKNVVVPVLASIVAVSILVAASISILWILKTRKKGTTWNNENNGTLQLKNRRFLYSEVLRITDNYERIIGRGGFGRVYHGNLDDTQVAVKMLFPSSVQGYKQFQAEVELLMRVHHKNWTTLVGYCDDGTHMGLIYEFMANGNLESHLLDEERSIADVLSWEGRLRIATETAQGLEYLHSGCKPPIIHRDVKPTNILLNEKFHAKIADFGLSRIFPVDTGTHISTVIAGTPGYLDPEYYTSNRLTEKSDVYSFGVVLLQMIASKPAIEKSIDRTHIIQWVSFMLAKGDIRNIVDPKLQGDFSMNSVWKATEVAMACVSQTSAKRPTMKQVVFDLNESLAIEMDRTTVGHEIESKDSSESISLNLRSELPPLAR